MEEEEEDGKDCKGNETLDCRNGVGKKEVGGRRRSRRRVMTSSHQIVVVIVGGCGK